MPTKTKTPRFIEEDLKSRIVNKIGMLKYDVLTFAELRSVVVASAKRLNYPVDSIKQVLHSTTEIPRIAKKSGMCRVCRVPKKFHYRGEHKLVTIYSTRNHEYWASQSATSISVYFTRKDIKIEAIKEKLSLKRQNEG